MGPLANGDLRHLRIVAHRKFDHDLAERRDVPAAGVSVDGGFFCIPLREAQWTIQ